MPPATPAASGTEGPDALPLDPLDGDAPLVFRIGTPGSADLEAALAGLDPARHAVLRIGNPLNAPLSPHRLMLQLASEETSEAEGARDDEAGQLLRAVVARAAGRPCLLVVIEQAETLTPAALTLLQLLPGLRGPGIPTVRVAFHGTAAFRGLLGEPHPEPIPEDTGSPAPPPALPRPPDRRRRLAVLGAGTAAALLAAAALLLFRAPAPQVVAAVVPAPPSPAAAVASSPLPPVTAAAPRAAEPVAPPADVASPVSSAEMPPPATEKPPPVAEVEDPAAARTRLFREFNAFVQARGLSGRLSRSEREILFGEYLASRQATAAANPPSRAPATAPATAPTAAIATALATVPLTVPPSQAAPAVVVFFRAGRPDAEARADEETAPLRQQFANLTLRPAADGPAEPTVRYFRPEDRSLAMTIALSLPPATPDWQIVDLSAAPDRPPQPTIEVWLTSPP